jgi:hypothetical protein
MIELFTVENGVIVPTVHCHTITYLKTIMDNYPDNYLKVYMYLFYMTCPNSKFNPYFNMPEEEKEETILNDIDADFSTEDDMIILAKDKCEQLYETPTMRAYKGISRMMERLAKYMSDTEISHGRDGNLTSIINAAAKYDGIRNSFKGIAKDLQDEQATSRRRGGSQGAYDQD